MIDDGGRCMEQRNGKLLCEVNNADAVPNNLSMAPRLDVYYYLVFPLSYAGTWSCCKCGGGGQGRREVKSLVQQVSEKVFHLLVCEIKMHLVQ